MFAKGLRTFSRNIRWSRKPSNSTTSCSVGRMDATKSVQCNKSTGYATYRSRTDEIVANDLGKNIKRASRSSQALRNRLSLRSVQPTLSIAVEVAAEKALATVADEEDDDGTYVPLYVRFKLNFNNY